VELLHPTGRRPRVEGASRATLSHRHLE
jgi:hypothetical protein